MQLQYGVNINELYKQLIKSVTTLNDYTEETNDVVDILNVFWATI